MTLDPIHVDTIARIAASIAGTVDDTDHDDHARAAWELLDPLREDGRVVVEPLDEPALRAAAIDDVALADRPFDTTHGLDAGTLNPTGFKNGLLLDVAQAAMAAAPTALDLHRSRSLVATVHANDATREYGTDWQRYDEGYSRQQVLQVPEVSQFADEVTHELALYLAESSHALEHAERVEELLLLDGPLYPKRLFNWESRDPALAEATKEAAPQAIVENYVRLVEEFVERGVPLAGFVKNPTSRFIVRTLSDRTPTPWTDDAALFTRLLEQRDQDIDETAEDPAAARKESDLTFTSWFRSRGSSDEPMSVDGDAMGIERRLDPECYEVTFCYLYDPRTDVTYKIEAPYAVTRDPETREALTTQLLSEVATERGPPEAIGKADELAKIGAGEKTAIRRKFEETFGSESRSTYDRLRWGEEE
ncbi:DNA double-strand break repair nuclease NurA [Halolamina sp. CBA1230]|uniref:DNA double-strand break repair nuclease NurA n=1 Tax=Halolamina sp. CBA1230 TaxID=1853690 RepID=UPI0009A198BE|nr:DNA double-strand break repair nuclease NurA [Halolamina sp. CBA1230]QKY19930.1 DNA double-strand break repair nuclease NurA [Halolamina sp. CBA1230]